MQQILYALVNMLGEMAPYILLGFLVAGIMHAFVPAGTMSRHLAGRGFGPVFKAAMIGVPLPLCSCGVLPAAVAMRRSGASRGASTSFLIATPQTGADSIAATWSLLGPAFALIRPVAALVTAFAGGCAVGAAEKSADAPQACVVASLESRPSFGRRCLDALRYGFVDLVSSIGAWLVAGLVIAALITVYVPADFFAALGDRPFIAMLAVLVVSVPMYVCATGSIPIAMSLMLKGLSPGTAFVLLMAGPAANFASFTLISREMGRKSAIIYLAAITAGAMAFGLAIDYLMPSAWFALDGSHAAGHGACMHLGPVQAVSAAVLAVLLIYSFIKRNRHKHNISTDMTYQYTVKGMNCPHCQASVAKAISGVAGVESVDVNLKEGSAAVSGSHDPEAVVAAVRAAGFDASPVTTD
ncbi:MAG: permease [Muribaculaceae bacterium]|nr:permease [Muribaculaceae bacterium]